MKSIRSGKPYSIEHRIRSASGECRWFLTRAEPFHDEQGKVCQWIGISTDIHDARTRFEARSVRDAESAKAELVNALAHEINNPLAALVNLVYLLNQRSSRDQSTQSFAQHIDEQLSRLVELVRNNLQITPVREAAIPTAEIAEQMSLFAPPVD